MACPRAAALKGVVALVDPDEHRHGRECTDQQMLQYAPLRDAIAYDGSRDVLVGCTCRQYCEQSKDERNGPPQGVRKVSRMLEERDVSVVPSADC
jgi:hypothetical protein